MGRKQESRQNKNRKNRKKWAKCQKVGSTDENSENSKGGGANMRPVLLFCPLKSNSAASSVSNIGIH